MGRYSPGMDPRKVLDAYEAALAPPAEVLAQTFGLLHITRTLIHADSLAYVFERKRDFLGREVCRAWRITEHPLAPPPTPLPSLAGGRAPDHYPRQHPDLKPEIEYVDVSCNDPRMEHVPPGSLKTPVPRHPG